jgi:hypothetical protein
MQLESRLFLEKTPVSYVVCVVIYINLKNGRISMCNITFSAHCTIKKSKSITGLFDVLEMVSTLQLASTSWESEISLLNFFW